jgi:hypothetical protein
MRESNFGFQAIEHRFQVLGGHPYAVEDAKKCYLSRFLIDIRGVGYIDHPRMEKLLERNRIAPLAPVVHRALPQAQRASVPMDFCAD